MGTFLKTLSRNELQLLNETLVSSNLPSSCDTVSAGFRCVKNKTLYYSKKYKRVKARNSYTVQFSVDSNLAYGKIKFLVFVYHEVFVFISKLQPLASSCETHFAVSHSSLDRLPTSSIIPLYPDLETEMCIHAESLVSKCVFINVTDSNEQYVVSFPNTLLQD